jgi:MoaA/NifB/PqqE/SkfB family radical SAM enzyme
MKLQLDGHKMIHHPDRVSQWLKEERIAPINLDIGISKWCNISCVFCSADSLIKEKHLLSRDILIRLVRDAAEAGVRSITIAGDGEPALNPALYDMVDAAKDAGLDIGLCSNGVLLEEDKLPGLLTALSFLKFTFQATTKESYKRIHRSNDFDRALTTIRKCVDIKNALKLNVALGIQMVLIPEVASEIVPLARLGRDIGVDYVQIKPCSFVDNRHGRGMKNYDPADYPTYRGLLEEAEKCSTENYKVFIKWGDLQSLGTRPYDVCYGTAFLHHVMSDGRVHPCPTFIDDKGFCFGDLTRNSYPEILAGAQYVDAIRKITNEVDVHTRCGRFCRQNGINAFLWQIMNAPEHVNFP